MPGDCRRWRTGSPRPTEAPRGRTRRGCTRDTAYRRTASRLLAVAAWHAWSTTDAGLTFPRCLCAVSDATCRLAPGIRAPRASVARSASGGTWWSLELDRRPGFQAAMCLITWSVCCWTPYVPPLRPLGGGRGGARREVVGPRAGAIHAPPRLRRLGGRLGGATSGRVEILLLRFAGSDLSAPGPRRWPRRSHTRPRHRRRAAPPPSTSARPRRRRPSQSRLASRPPGPAGGRRA